MLTSHVQSVKDFPAVLETFYQQWDIDSFFDVNQRCLHEPLNLALRLNIVKVDDWAARLNGEVIHVKENSDLSTLPCGGGWKYLQVGELTYVKCRCTEWNGKDTKVSLVRTENYKWIPHSNPSIAK